MVGIVHERFERYLEIRVCDSQRKAGIRLDRGGIVFFVISPGLTTAATPFLWKETHNVAAMAAI